MHSRRDLVGLGASQFEGMSPERLVTLKGQLDMEVADRIGLELATVRLVALDLRQAGGVVALQAAMKR